MTPQIFAENVTKRLAGRAEVIAHDKEWAKEQGMGSFLSVAQGSIQPPIFLEITYNGKDDKSQPICLVGKGNLHVTQYLFKYWNGINLK